MDDWEKFNETLLPEKEDFYSHLNMEDITDADYTHTKRVSKDLEITNFEEYHKQYSIVSRCIRAFEICVLKIYELDSARFLTTPGLAWQAALEKTKEKLDLLTDVIMLLMVEKDIRRGIWHTIYQYTKANNKYMNDYDENKEFSYLKYWDVNNSYGWEMSQKLLVNDFKWVEDFSEFSGDFIRSCNDESDEGYFLEVDTQCPENLHNLINDLPCLAERIKNLLQICVIN